jgi:hypothetical protein
LQVHGPLPIELIADSYQLLAKIRMLMAER